ncbi:676_t:CDS:2 [Acaulospora colombiana]|uniref:676_t:CDS:1 n=1 Tax=Acaulospora colombiana TaxID=27376 RepID=A0ACA9JY06_9GLOM|nr:676_t:CDS:2 [Acaulospora colombiana]
MFGFYEQKFDLSVAQVSVAIMDLTNNWTDNDIERRERAKGHHGGEERVKNQRNY